MATWNIVIDMIDNVFDAYDAISKLCYIYRSMKTNFK